MENNNSFALEERILEPNSLYTFHYDDFEISIKTNKFTTISFSKVIPHFSLRPIEKMPDLWTKTN